MSNYLEVLNSWMSQPNYLLIVLIGVYLIAATLDFIAGTFNAAYSEDITFSSRTAQLGIVRKLLTVAVMVLVVPLALMLSFDIGVYSLTVLYVGIVVSEIYSVLGHIGIVKDGDKHKNIIGSLFENLLDSVFRSKVPEDKKNE